MKRPKYLSNINLNSPKHYNKLSLIWQVHSVANVVHSSVRLLVNISCNIASILIHG
jgi:hypothetical protein